jgi:hypothetical protein
MNSSSFNNALQRQLIAERSREIEEFIDLRTKNIRELLRRAREAVNLSEASQWLELAEFNAADEKRAQNLHRLLGT